LFMVRLRLWFHTRVKARSEDKTVGFGKR
jgi:hypothetical protein